MSQPILFIAIYFPPVGGPGTNRSFQFVNYLGEFGYKPVVLTLKEKDALLSPYPLDTSMVKLISPFAEIVRINSYELTIFKKVLMNIKLYRFFWFLFYPLFWDNYPLFPFYGYFRAIKEIKRNNIKLVYTSSGPFSSLLLGYFLKLTTSIKWVADMRDPFTENSYRLWPGKFQWYFSRWMEKIVFSKTDLLIVNTHEVKKQYLKRKLQHESNISVITNGY